jgi:hypothetical protein
MPRSFADQAICNERREGDDIDIRVSSAGRAGRRVYLGTGDVV